MKPTIQYYRELFGVTPEMLRKLIGTALSRGGDYADLFFEHSLSNDLSLRDGTVNATGTQLDFGVGIRVLSGDRTGYAYSESTRPEEMEKAARTAAAIASLPGSRIPVPEKTTLLQGPDRYPIGKGWEETSPSDKIPYLKMLNELIFQGSDKTVKVTARISDSETKVLFYNSLGETYGDDRPMISIVSGCVMQSGSRTETGSYSRSYRAGFEILSEELIRKIARETLSRTEFLFGARQPKGGAMPVVMGSGGSGILLHEAVGHAFEADFNRKNISIFADKMGKEICHPAIDIVDDGTLPGNRGAVNFDDEGIPWQKTYLVKEGRLHSYLHDRISAAHYGVPPTGNGRRESFRYMPIPRMRATYMENGTAPEADLIASVKNGVYVDNFSNGQVQIGAGDFTFYVNSGYRIENGRLTQPIKDINIIGNGPEALRRIVAVADNARIDDSTWTCGKEQYCPVSCGMPSVLVDELIVGGNN